MIDKEGYRPNIGIVLANTEGKVFWARRCNQDGWQFPQGGIKPNETIQQALFRELQEEVGLLPAHVEIVARTRDWLRYDIPKSHLRNGARNLHFRGQKQIWFLLRFVGAETLVRLDASALPEFDAWRWVDYWSPLETIVAFKRDVYRSALTELEPYLRPQAVQG